MTYSFGLLLLSILLAGPAVTSRHCVLVCFILALPMGIGKGCKAQNLPRHSALVKVEAPCQGPRRSQIQ